MLTKAIESSLDKIINYKSGLHNRITRRILLEPFDLHATKEFLSKKGVKLSNRQITQLYMLTGGVPYYLTFVNKGYSTAQLIDELAFSKHAPLLTEFDNLFSSLFNSHEVNIKLIRAIASKRYCIGKEALFNLVDESLKGKSGIAKLKEMEEAGFIMSFLPYNNKQKGRYYRVIDEYTLFYLKWIEPIKEILLKTGAKQGYWQTQQNTPAWYGWSGLAFEAICYKHILQVSDALRLSAMALLATWRYQSNKYNLEEQGAQIDLLFDRDDDAITICEIKYSDKPYMIDKNTVKNLLNKCDRFIEYTRTKKQIFMALITSSNVKNNFYADEYISNIVSLDDLFK